MSIAAEDVSGLRPRFEALRGLLGRIIREPLVHFLLLGVVLFAGITEVRAFERPTVSIDAQDVNQLVEYWQLQSARPPTKAELSAIIQERVDEELLAREAQRLGMDKGDLIIRRRLAQKMAFASEDLGDQQPTTAALQAEYERTKAQYAAPAKIAFRHVFFSADRGVNAARTAATKALELAKSGKSDLGGDPSLLPVTYADASPESLAKDYGPDLTKLATDTPPGQWAGPVQSPYGFHIVRVESRSAPQIPPFEEVRDRVKANYLAAQRRTRNEAFLQKLRQKYHVEIAGATP